MKERFDRQSFLGEEAEEIIARARVGIAGLGGGGSHIVQQLAHVGVRDFQLFDGDVVEESNLNRMVGASAADAVAGTAKAVVAERVVRALTPNATVRAHRCRWQEAAEELETCDLVFGCVDGFLERDQLERTARRYLIPYIDIGLDVHTVEGEPPRMAGQVITSMPGSTCMWCLGFLTEEKLAREAARYGAAGHRPQVVWANGVLASTAVGLGIGLLTGWTQSTPAPLYLQYDANLGTVVPHVRAQYAPKRCEHYDLQNVGPVQYQPV